MTIKSQCSQCKNHIIKTRCKAFKQIPVAILLNDFDHKKEYPGDDGIRFEALEETKKEF